MNDRFKFRVWDKAIGEMSYDVCVGFINDGLKRDWVCADTTCGQIDYTDNRLKDIEIMQCTGLKDKNGNLIYEGDVIVIPNQYPFYDEGALNYIGIVENIYNSWQYVYHCVNPLKNGISEGINYLLNECGFEENENSYFEIIGNIYENKELLNDNRIRKTIF